MHDLWFASAGSTSRPAVKPARSGTYSTHLYTNFVVDHIKGHGNSNSTAPLFGEFLLSSCAIGRRYVSHTALKILPAVYAAYQGVHYPLQVPKSYFDRYAAQGANSGDCIWESQAVTKGGQKNGFSCAPDPLYPLIKKAGLDCKCNRLLVGHFTSKHQSRLAWACSRLYSVDSELEARRVNGAYWGSLVKSMSRECR